MPSKWVIFEFRCDPLQNQDQIHTHINTFEYFQKPIGISSRIVVFVRLWNAMFKVLRDFSDDFSIMYFFLFFLTLFRPFAFILFTI